MCIISSYTYAFIQSYDSRTLAPKHTHSLINNVYFLGNKLNNH